MATKVEPDSVWGASSPLANERTVYDYDSDSIIGQKSDWFGTIRVLSSSCWKQNFQHHYSSLQCHMILQKSLYADLFLKHLLLLLWNGLHFVETINVFILTFDQFNVKIIIDPKPLSIVYVIIRIQLFTYTRYRHFFPSSIWCTCRRVFVTLLFESIFTFVLNHTAQYRCFIPLYIC